MPSYLDKHARSQVCLHVHVLLPEGRRSGRCWQATEDVTSILHLFFTQKSMDKYISLYNTEYLKFFFPLERKKKNGNMLLKSLNHFHNQERNPLRFPLSLSIVYYCVILFLSPYHHQTI